MLSTSNSTTTTAASNGQLWVAPEDAAEFAQMQSALTLEFAPASEFQRQCLLTMIHCLWTIRRTRIAECKMQERAYNNGLIDPMLDPDWARQLKGILDMRRQSERSLIQAKKDFYTAPMVTATATATAASNNAKPKIIRMPNPTAIAATTIAAPVSPQQQPSIHDSEATAIEIRKVGS
jgi:hypothetical protein